MDLANEGRRGPLNCSGPSDAVTVFAVDSEAHKVVPLSKIGGDARTIGSGGAAHRKARAAASSFIPGSRPPGRNSKNPRPGQRHVVLSPTRRTRRSRGLQRNSWQK